MRTPKILLLLPWILLAVLKAAGEPRPIPPAFGSYINLAPGDYAESKSFKSTDRIIGTYYFYWYDVETKSHLVNGDGSDALTTHPPSLENFSYRSVAWHKQQLSDMTEAGIDVALMVFWGAPSEQDSKTDLHWSYEGLKPLVRAREELLRAGKSPPKIGLFYDTSTLRHNAWREHIDLKTDYGQRWFYATVRDFYSCIPPKHWAMIDDKPIVLMYAAAFAKDYDQRFIDFTRVEFAREFGGRVPYLVPQNSFLDVKGDSTCAWGGALVLQRAGICAIGPGYDHSAVPGRKKLVRAREGGKFYEQSWLKFLRAPSNFVMLETWNEFHEGTDICESKEYGRLYIHLTRKYAALFKKGWKPSWPKGKFTDAKSVSAVLGNTNQEMGLRQIENEDGVTRPTVVNGQEARFVETPAGQPRFIYFAADDTFKWADSMNLKLRVEYFDAASGELKVEFDGSDASAPFEGAYTSAKETVLATGTKTWKTAEFSLPEARLLNSQNRESDFRLVVNSPELLVRRVSLLRP